MTRTAAAARLCSQLGSDRLPLTAALSSTDWWLPSIKAQSQSSPGTGTTSAVLSADQAERFVPRRSHPLRPSSCPPPGREVPTASPQLPFPQRSSVRMNRRRGGAQRDCLFLPFVNAGAWAGAISSSREVPCGSSQ